MKIKRICDKECEEKLGDICDFKGGPIGVMQLVHIIYKNTNYGNIKSKIYMMTIQK